MAKLLHAHPSGPYLLGQEPSYADFVLVSALQFCVRAGDHDDNDIFKRIVAADNAYAEVYDACKPWLERDNY